jgi:hypothetical protein
MDEDTDRQFAAGEEYRHQHRDEVNCLIHRLTSAAERSSSAAGNRASGARPLQRLVRRAFLAGLPQPATPSR